MAVLATYYQLDKWAHLGMGLKLGETYALEELERRAREMGGNKLLNKLQKTLVDSNVFRPAPLWHMDPAPRIVLEAFLLSRGCVSSVDECVSILKPCTEKNPHEFIAEHCLCRLGVASLATDTSTALCALGTRLRRHATARALTTITTVYEKCGTLGAVDYGDAVFKHPFIQCLLKSARQQVAETLDGKPPHWMICVRTYGRSGNPVYGKWPRRGGKGGKGVLDMTLAALERTLGPRAHKHVLIFVSHEDQDFVSGRYSASLHGTPWEHRIVIGVKGAHLQTRFIEESFPKQTHVVIADDNIYDFVADHSLKKVRKLDDGKELSKLITRAGTDMQEKGASIWGLCASINPQTLHSFGEQVRRGNTDVTENVGLIYGAFFGIIVQRDAKCYTRWGQVADDVERSIRYFQRDGIVLRYKLYGVVKSHEPGVWSSSKRGISSASSSAQKHVEEKRNALEGIIGEFAKPCCRLPRPGEASNVGRCGVVWLRAGSSSAATRKRAERPAASTRTARKRARKDEERIVSLD